MVATYNFGSVYIKLGEERQCHNNKTMGAFFIGKY